MKKLFLSFSLSLFLSFAHSQTTKDDVIYLKNGSVLQGTIIEEDKNSSIKLKVSEETVLVIAFDDIKDISHKKKENISSEMPKKSMKLNLAPEKGMYAIMQLRGGQAFASISASTGYSFGKSTFGVGGAFQPYLNIGAITPLFVEYRQEIGKKEKRIKPLILGQLGYGFPVVKQNARRDTISGGVYWNVGFGYKEYTARKFQWTYGIVFSQQYVREVWDRRFQTWNPDTGTMINTTVHFNTQKVYNRVLISWGLWF